MPFLYNLQRVTGYRRYLRNNATQSEKLLWGLLRRRQIYEKKFRRQYSIRGYIVDFYCPELKLAVEIDGPVHRFIERQDRDRKRQIRLERYGFHFFRCTSDEVYSNVEAVINRLTKTIITLQKGRY